MTHTVLVVEDEQQLREMMRDALELNGYAVVTAEHGQDALTKLAEIEHLCLVILDLLMPVMDGRTFIAKMRERAELSSVPIVVHTSAPGQTPAGRLAGDSKAADVRSTAVGRAGILRPVASTSRA